MKIFNHDITLSTQEHSDAIHFYSGRALGLSQPGDKVQMHPKLAAEWDAITAHYTRIGLTFTHDVIWDTSVLETTKYPDYETSFYFLATSTMVSIVPPTGCSNPSIPGGAR
jgi:hypothetical protein